MADHLDFGAQFRMEVGHEVISALNKLYDASFPIGEATLDRLFSLCRTQEQMGDLPANPLMTSMLAPHEVAQIQELELTKRYLGDYLEEHEEALLDANNNGTLVFRSCPKCESDQKKPVLQNTTGNDYVSCSGCGMVYMDPILGKEDMDRIYLWDSTSSKKQFWENRMKKMSPATAPPETVPPRVQLLKNFKPQGRLLDFGCSHGTFLNLAKFYYQAEGLEVDPRTAAFSRDRLGLKVHNCFLEDFSPDQPFELITMFQVIEHLPDPKETLRQLRDLLSQDGFMLIECPNIDSFSLEVLGSQHRLIFGNEHVNMFSVHSLPGMLQDLGFRVVHCTTYDLDLEIYDMVGKCFADQVEFFHKVSYRNFITIPLLRGLNHLFSQLTVQTRANKPTSGSYLQVVASKF